MPENTYLDPTDAQAMALFSRDIKGPLVMLNLLRFREMADYSGYPALAPPEPISGREAYDHYIEHTLPYLTMAGGNLVYIGRGGGYLIGPQGSGWDLAMLVRQNSVEAFMDFAANEGYLAGIGHRVAATRDSRILPLEDVELASASEWP